VFKNNYNDYNIQTVPQLEVGLGVISTVKGPQLRQIEDSKCIEFIVLYTFERISRSVAQELFFFIFQIIVLSLLYPRDQFPPLPYLMTLQRHKVN
jgi:hypothetical protein